MLSIRTVTLNGKLVMEVVHCFGKILSSSSALRDIFPCLYELSDMKFVRFRIFVYKWRYSEDHVSSFWSRNQHAWESSFLNVMEVTIVNTSFMDTEDKLLWSVKSSPYTPKDCYRLLSEVLTSSVFWSALWKIQVPSKVLTFL